MFDNVVDQVVKQVGKSLMVEIVMCSNLIKTVCCALRQFALHSYSVCGI